MMMHTPTTISDSAAGPRTVCAADGLPWPCPDAVYASEQDVPVAEPPAEAIEAPQADSDGQGGA